MKCMWLTGYAVIFPFFRRWASVYGCDTGIDLRERFHRYRKLRLAEPHVTCGAVCQKNKL